MCECAEKQYANMKMCKYEICRWTILAVAILISVIAGAQGGIDNIRNQPYMKNAISVDCERAMTTSDMRICANLAYQRSDSILVSIYYRLLTESTSKEKVILINLQKQWRAFRDRHCGVVWDKYEGGSMQSIVYLICLREMTENRVEELKLLLEE